MFCGDDFPMKSKYGLLSLIGLISPLIGCAEAGNDGWLTVPSDRYVLISRSLNDPIVTNYAAVKITQQGSGSDDVLKYEWVSLNSGESIVSARVQNFKAGSKDIVGRFGIGFEGYRFAWKGSDRVSQGRIKSIWHGVEGVRYCLSELTEVWGINLERVIAQLEDKGKCQ